MTTLTRAEWLAQRGTYVGASEIASILGLPGAYGTIGSVWLDKVTAQDRTDAVDAADELTAMDLDPETAEKLDRKSIGLLVEPAILTMYEQRNPAWKVRRNGLQIWRHPKFPFIGATLDAEAVTDFGDLRTVEAKNVNMFKRQEWGDEGSDSVPQNFVAQGVQQMLVREHLGYGTACDYPVLFGGGDFRVFTVPYDRTLARQIEEALQWFWNLVETRTLPPIDYSGAGAAKLMRQIYSKIVGDPKVITGRGAYHAAGLIYARDFAHTKEQEWKAVKEGCTAELLAIAENAPRVEIHLPGVNKRLAIIRSPRKEHYVDGYTVPANHVLQFDPYQLPKRTKFFAELGDENANQIEHEKQKQIGSAPENGAVQDAGGNRVE